MLNGPRYFYIFNLDGFVRNACSCMPTLYSMQYVDMQTCMQMHDALPTTTSLRQNQLRQTRGITISHYQTIRLFSILTLTYYMHCLTGAFYLYLYFYLCCQDTRCQCQIPVLVLDVICALLPIQNRHYSCFPQFCRCVWCAIIFIVFIQNL